MKKVLLKIYQYCIMRPVFYLIGKFYRENPQDKATMEELRKRNKENDERLERETLAKIESMPPNYREHFRKLNVSGLQFFLAAHAIEGLIKRTVRHHNLPYDIGAIFGPGGTIGFGKVTELMNSISWECEIVVPASTTTHEIMIFARIDEETAKKIAMFIACSLHYCDTLIPNFRAVETGILQLVKKENAK